MAKTKSARVHSFIKPYVVESGKDFRLKDHDPGDTHNLNSEDKPEAKKLVQEGVEMLSDLQDILYAQGSWGLLLIFQAMDAAGNDSTITHVMSGLNPQGVDVHTFKMPSTEELSQPCRWRTSCLI